MKKLQLTIEGGAAELVVGTLTAQEIEKIHEVMKDNDLAEEQEDGSFEYEYGEFFYDSSLCDEADLSEWYGIDDLYHQHGPVPNGATITVTNMDTDEVVYENDLSAVLDLIKSSPEEYSFDQEDIPEGGAMLTVNSAEKGDAFSGEFEVEDDHVFDPKLLSFSHILVNINDDYFCDIIEYLSYNDEDIDNDGYSTYGKSTDFDLIFK